MKLCTHKQCLKRKKIDYQRVFQNEGNTIKIYKVSTGFVFEVEGKFSRSNDYFDGGLTVAKEGLIGWLTGCAGTFSHGTGKIAEK